jgi:hypothetical protein
MFMTATIQSIVRGTPTTAGSSVGSRKGNVKVLIQTPKKGGIEVVDRADDGRHRRPEQDAARLTTELEERERRHEDPEEDGDPAETRNGVGVQPARLRPVDDAEKASHPAHRGGQEDHDHECCDRAVEDLRMVAQGVHRPPYFVP